MVVPVEQSAVLYGIGIGALFALFYCVRVLFLMERKISRIEIHIENLVSRVLSEELKIEKEELKIEKKLGTNRKKKKK